MANYFINYYLGTALSCSLVLAGLFAACESLRWIFERKREQKSKFTANVFPSWKEDWRERNERLRTGT
jgi:hypothetical protein